MLFARSSHAERPEKEINNNHFNVEISKDGKTFVKAATVNSKHKEGNSTSATHYSVLIENTDVLALSGISFITLLFVISLVFKPAQRKSLLVGSIVLFAGCCITIASCKKVPEDFVTEKNSVVYLRLAQVDKDGAIAYSRVIKVVKE